jgi:hypothetical protein
LRLQATSGMPHALAEVRIRRVLPRMRATSRGSKSSEHMLCPTRRANCGRSDKEQPGALRARLTKGIRWTRM